MIAPVFRSPGAKWRLAPRIVSVMPRHDIYLEPYFGSGAVLFSKPPSRVETVNDFDGEVANLFRVLRDPDSRRRLVEAVEFTVYAEQELWRACEGAENLDEVERARRLVVRSWLNVGARQIGAQFFRYAGANSNENPASAWAALPSRIRVAGERLRGVQVLNRDAVEVIRAHQTPDVLIYADPPYPHSARTGHGMLYRCEMTDEQHETLLQALREHPGPAVLSGFQCEMYDEALGDWRRIALRGYAQSHGATEEVLWLNQAAAQRCPNTLF